jgi:hypothetical protein
LAVLYFNEAATGSADGSSEANGFTDLQTAMNAVAAGDTLYLKNGSSRYGSASTTITFTVDAGAAVGNTRFEGYGSTPGDGVLFQTATVFNITGDHSNWLYIDVDASGGGNSTPYAWNAYVGNCIYYRCKMKMAGMGVGNASSYGVFKPLNSAVIECSIIGKIGNASSYIYYNNRCMTTRCYIESTSDGIASVGGNGVICQGGHRDVDMTNCIVVEKRATPGTSHGIWTNGEAVGGNYIFHGNTVVGWGGDGIRFQDGPDTDSPYSCTVSNNILYDLGGYGINNNQGTNSYTHAMVANGNAFGSVTSGQTNNMDMNIGAVTLSGDPFVDQTDFILNTTSGAGALCRGVAGVPDMKNPALAATRLSFPSIGAMQPELGGAAPIISVF